MKKFLLIFGIFLFPLSLHAAELYWAVGAKESDGMRTIALMLRATTPVGALAGNIPLPRIATFSSVSLERSLVDVWTDKPHIDKNNYTLAFSGIIPEGFSGIRSVFRFRTGSDPLNFLFKKEHVQILLNDGSGTPDEVVVRPPEYLTASFAVHEQAQNFFVPNASVGNVADAPTRHEFSDQYRKDPIVVRYEVAYADTPLRADDPLLRWEFLAASSPSASAPDGVYIYLKASDNNGNIHTAVFSPVSGGVAEHAPAFVGALVAVILGLGFLLWRAKEKRERSLFRADEYANGGGTP